MVHLIRKNGKLHVVEVSTNHEIVKSSQSKGFTTRKGAYKNITASAKNYVNDPLYFSVLVQDDTGEQPRMIEIEYTAGSLKISPSDVPAGKKFEAKRSPGRRATKKQSTGISKTRALVR